MDIGALRHRITIQESSSAADAYGGADLTWSDLATVWAAVEPLSGREFLEGRRAENEINYKIRIRHRSGLAADTMRVSWRSRVFDIEAVIDRYTESKEIWLMCRELIE